jgi:hypothetical protein
VYISLDGRMRLLNLLVRSMHGVHKARVYICSGTCPLYAYMNVSSIHINGTLGKHTHVLPLGRTKKARYEGKKGVAMSSLFISSVFVWSSGLDVSFQCKRSWVRFPGSGIVASVLFFSCRLALHVVPIRTIGLHGSSGRV